MGIERAWRRFKRWYRRPFRARKLACRLNPVDVEQLHARRVSILLPTFNRRRYLEIGLPRLIAALRKQNCEVIVWDNASVDGTADYLRTLNSPKLKFVAHNENIGINALAELAKQADGEFILQLDDDVIGYPEDFVARLLAVYLAVPDMGYLGTNVVVDQWTTGGRLPAYRSVRVNHKDFEIDYGAVGGWCTLTDRELYDQVGGFLQKPGETYFWADLDYYRKVGKLGRKRGILLGLEVYHAFRLAIESSHYNAILDTEAARNPNHQKMPVQLANESFWHYFRQRFPVPSGEDHVNS